MNWLREFFRPVAAAQVLARQLFDAERLHAEHLAAGEMHIAMSAVYERRADRIRKLQAGHTELRAVK
jgi:hypothetical protein